MIQKINSVVFQNKFNSKSLAANPQNSKFISFGELDDCGDYFSCCEEREKIEQKYRERLSRLAYLADSVGIDKSSYYAQRREIEFEKERELRNYDMLNSNDD